MTGTPSHRSLLAAALAGAMSLLTLPTGGAAQSITGRIVDDLSGAPLAATSVLVLDTAGVAVGRTDSDSTGWFQVRVPRRGLYRLFADRLAYGEVMSGDIPVTEGRVEVEIRMTPTPMQVEGIVVSSERRRARLEEKGYYRRRLTGTGYFVDPDDVAAQRPLRTTDLLRQIPGVSVRPDTLGTGNVVLLRGFRGGVQGCTPRVVIDGWPIELHGISLDDMVHASDVLAIEVYPSGAGAPVRHTGLVGGCGVILIWTG